MHIVQGDLITRANMSHFDTIIHGCNCFNTMSAGVAYRIAKAFPAARNVDHKTCPGDLFKLGTYSYVTVLSNCGLPLTIINAYTQYRLGADARYNAIESALWLISLHFPNAVIGYPKIGCGIGGLDWNKVQDIFDRVFEGMDHTLVEYVLNPEQQRPVYSTVEHDRSGHRTTLEKRTVSDM